MPCHSYPFTDFTAGGSGGALHHLELDIYNNGHAFVRDDSGRIRMDDWEMREAVQTEVDRLWPDITTDNLNDTTDIWGYQKEFLRLFGFGIDGVDYDADVDPVVQFADQFDGSV